ncbi:MAG: hypothetical protein Q8N65_00735 [bacterium]|nr:hypothetical protein [bacterium]
MNQKEINKQIFKRLEKLEKAAPIKGLKLNQGKKFKIGGKISLPNLILKLRDDNKFFSQSRSANEVHEKLLPVYSCKINRVNMALKRLVERKKLRITDKIIKGKKTLAYVW